MASDPAYLRKNSYTSAQVDMICSHMSDHYAFSTKLAFEAGLRPMELIGIYQDSKGQYKVIGKSNVHREIKISEELSKELERRRRKHPIPITEKNNTIISYYDIGSGLKFQSAFSSASKRTLNWSLGTRGLRRAWAQRRHEELKQIYPVKTVIKIVQFELGEVTTGLGQKQYCSIEDILIEHIE